MEKAKMVTVIVVSCIVLGNSGFVGSERDENLKDTGIQYQILPRGVQDFSDGEVAMVEKPIEIVPGDEYYTVSGAYYGCLIKREVSGNFLKIEIGDASIAYELPGEQPFGKVKVVEGVPEEKKDKPKSFSYKGISEDLDLRYTFSHHKVLEEFVLSKFRHVRIVERFEMEKVWYSVKEDGIHFYHVETGEEVFFIPPPVMYEEGNEGERCYDIHYEIEMKDGKYVIEKIIDEKGLEWLKAPERKYPVIVDSTTEGALKDPWEESGLLPYEQYFKWLNEYVSPTNGSLTVNQTDFYLPGRGMDLVIKRIYTTPQAFIPDTDDPYAYVPTEEAPPWSIGNGWRLDFPGIAGDYLYLWEGRMYKIEWVTDPPDCTGWCTPPAQPEEEVFNNHKGDHFRLIKHVDGTYTLYLKDGKVCQFSSYGVIQWIRDDNGNEIHFTTNLQSDGEGHVTIISAIVTDTVGRVISVSRGGVTYGGVSITYTNQYVDGNPLLTRVTDSVGRVTSYYYEYFFLYGSHQYRNKWLLTKIIYPTQGYSTYSYARRERRYCKDECSIYSNCHEMGDCYDRTYQFPVATQSIYASANDLNCVRTYSFTGDWEEFYSCVETTKDGDYYVQATTYFSIADGKVMAKTLKDYQGTQREKTVYEYNAQGEVTLTQVYRGNTSDISYQEFSAYDEWGNNIYSRNNMGVEVFSCYNNGTAFTDYSGNLVTLLSNQFYTNSFSTVHDKLVATCSYQEGSTLESYYLYNGTDMVESKDVYEGKSYIVFRGLFDENGQTQFPFDLTTFGNAVLRITAIPTQNLVRLSETHSVSTHQWYQNTGYWKNSSFYAYYIKGEVDGYDPVGPFVHYPGTSGYESYEKWVDGRTQYVKTYYKEYQNKSPVICSYRLNGGSWTQITSNLGNGMAQTTVPQERFTSQNVLEFSESSSYKTRFEWVLFVPVEAQSESYVKNYTYDTYGNIVSASNCYGDVTFTYDSVYHAYLTGVTDPLENTISAEYDDRGNIITLTDANEHTYHYEYDLLNRLTKKINPDITEREAVYNDTLNTVTIYDELDHYVKKYLDGLGRVTEVENAEYTEEYTYNYLGKVETKTRPLGRVYTYEYDETGRLLYSYNPDSTYKRMVYNDKDSIVEAYDENGNKRELKYDWGGNLVWVKEYINGSFSLTEYQYDERGNLTRMKDARGNTTLYDYGMFGVKQIRYPDSTQESFVYDCIGNLTQKAGGSRIITYHYNAGSQLTQIEYPDSSVFFTYDANGNRTSMQDPNSSAAYEYDSRNRLTSETKTIDEVEYTISYVYDAASHLVFLTYPDNTVVEQTYDDVGRLTSIDGYADYLWNETELQQITYANGVTTDYSYDTRGRPTHIHTQKTGSDLLKLTYTYDVVGNILQMKNTENVGGQEIIKEQWDYTYDQLNRLRTAVGNSYSFTYTYDSTGNRTQLNNTTYSYNEMNELISTGGEGGGLTFEYDSFGNCIEKSDGTKTWEYAYDDENRLTAVKEDGVVSEEYVYDGDGHRIKKTDSSAERVYVYSGINVLYEVNVTTHLDSVYIYGPTGRIAKKVSDIAEYYHADHLGSTRLITTDNGIKTGETQYQPFGEEINAFGERYSYNGKERDDTGLYYYGARYYDPQIGRFLTRDVVRGDYEIPQGLNRYTYCRNNPLLYTDPDGRMEKRFAIEGSGYAHTPPEFQYAYAEFGNIACVNLYILKESDNSEVQVTGMITYELQKTTYEDTYHDPSEPASFCIAVEEGIQDAVVKILAAQEMDLKNSGSTLLPDLIVVQWNTESGEAGDNIYVFFYFTVTSSGEKELVIVISYHPLNCKAPPFEGSTAQVTIPPASNNPGNHELI